MRLACKLAARHVDSASVQDILCNAIEFHPKIDVFLRRRVERSQGESDKLQKSSAQASFMKCAFITASEFLEARAPRPTALIVGTLSVLTHLNPIAHCFDNDTPRKTSASVDS